MDSDRRRIYFSGGFCGGKSLDLLKELGDNKNLYL